MTTRSTYAELDRQVATLHRLGYPALAGLTAGDFEALVEPLRDLLEDGEVEAGTIPFVLVVTHHPDVFTARNAFQALGSRAANKRVPSFWVSKGAPRLGWCWAGNPHTWLGAGSAAGRLAA